MLSASEVSFSRWGAIQIYLPLPLPLEDSEDFFEGHTFKRIERYTNPWIYPVHGMA